MELLEYPFDSALILQKKRLIKRELLKQEELIEKKVAILSGSTIGDIKNILEIFLLNQGIKPIFYEGQYGRYYEDIMFTNNELTQFKPDFIYIHTSNKNIHYLPKVDDDVEAINKKFEKVINDYYILWKKIKENYGCTIIQNNFELPSYRILGNKDVSDVHGITNFINKLNLKFSEYAQSTRNFYINDINYLSATYGIERWCNSSNWYLYKYCLGLEYIPYLCSNLANIIKSILGKNKKSIILDLDNTIWGGVIGEVGVEGITVGNETPLGMSYSEFQNYLKEVSKTGVNLNICSKNELKNALDGLSHKGCILKTEDFICIKANWEDKNLNILDISSELNVMMDSIVFIDDNPAERAIVKENISQVSVPKIESPDYYISILDKSGFFEVTNISEDDKNRNDFYKKDKERKILQENFKEFSEYLKSLKMTCNIEKFKEEKLERIVQLINKTNQFNLTTKRYTENEVLETIHCNDYLTICASLEDKFGENGIVSLFIGSIEKDILHIDLWVMSCRVFKRNLEFSVFDYLVEKCIELNIRIIKGYYYESKKNSLVKEFYKSIEFNKISEDNNDSTWEFVIPKEYKKINEVMGVIYNE